MTIKRRILLKAISWESFSWLLTLGIAYLYTGSLGESSSLATVCLGLKIVCFYAHELIWERVC